MELPVLAGHAPRRAHVGGGRRGAAQALPTGTDAELADASEFGLGLSIGSADPDRAVRLARSIRSGAAFVNAVVASDPRLPFGGTKRSGHGRELAAAGTREFTTVRTYWVEPGSTIP